MGMTRKERQDAAKTLLAAARRLERGGKVSAKAAPDSIDGMLNSYTLKVAEGLKKAAGKSLTTVKPAKVNKNSGPLGNACTGTGGTAENPIEWVAFVEPDIKSKYMRLKIAYIFYKGGPRVKDDYMEFASDYPMAKVIRDCTGEMTRIMSLVGR